MDDLDSLFGDDVLVPFTNTAKFEGHRFLCEGLLRRDTPQHVLDPVPPTFTSSDESSSDDDSPITPDDFSAFDAVSAAFAPGGQSAANSRFGYQLKDREPATNPPVKKMILIAPNGTQIFVAPRCFPKKKVTRACVELAVCQWMEDQQNLPPGAQNQVQIQTGNVNFEVDGEIYSAPVWLWKGLEQVADRPDTYRLYL